MFCKRKGYDDILNILNVCGSKLYATSLPLFEKEVIILEMKYRLNQERLLSEHKLNKEILIHSLARLNKKINMLYRSIKKRESEMMGYDESSAYRLYLQQQIVDYSEKRELLIKKRQPILHVVMSAYRLSLDDIKRLLRESDQEKFPTYKTIDNIVSMIECADYSLL